VATAPGILEKVAQIFLVFLLSVVLFKFCFYSFEKAFEAIQENMSYDTNKQ